MIYYDLYPHRPKSHVFKVVMRVEPSCAKSETFFLPAWLPGSYMIRDFAKHIINIQGYLAHNPQVPVPIRKIKTHTFEVQPWEGTLILEYEVYAWDRSVRGAHFDLTHAFFNGSALFLCSNSFQDHSVQLVLHRPQETYQAKAWKVATSLKPLAIDAAGFGSYSAQNYEDLIDHPTEMGTFEEVAFTLQDVKHRIIITGLQESDLERLAYDVKKLCEQQVNLFQDLPFENYVFLLTALEESYGGLEHLSSSALICQKRCLPSKNGFSLKDYRILLGLFSHEYFHAWMVKRIKPQEFYDLNLREIHHTDQLWAFEGFTAYYDDLMLFRAQCITPFEYLEVLSETMNRVYSTPGRFIQTLKESSFDAWIKFYQPNENSINSTINYYTKGTLAGLLFDLHIRKISNNQYSLDDVMRKLWQDYGRNNIGVAPDAIEKILLEFGGPAMQDLIYLVLETTQELPLAQLLQDFGIALTYHYSEELK
ncbi:MAG TPA: peptidase M61, partial [Gammaproteobacteria bacterium]|nr:peptidase M61 [Gammaproteobacteria bacterium]